MAEPKLKVVILGGGFGGIKAALELAKNDDFDVTLISESDNFRYYPTLYRAATGSKMSAASIPLSEVFQGKSINIKRASAKKISRQTKQVQTPDEIFKYDYLIVALGVVTNYFGIKGLKENSFGIKSQQEADELRSQIHKNLVDDKKPDSNYIIIGGGPTGVELAGALPAYIKYVMKRHGLPRHKLHIDLVEAAPRLMPRMDRHYSAAATKRLRRLGVKVLLNETVQAETADSLTMNDHSIKSHTVVWTAGVTNHPFLKLNKFKLDEHGKAVVNEYLESEPNVFVIGDNASTPFSGMAQTALYDAKFVADNLHRLARGNKLQRYKPKQPSYVTPVGPKWAAVKFGQLHLYGWLGWMLRSAADFLGYRDYEPWWKASQHWIAAEEHEQSCPVCK